MSISFDQRTLIEDLQPYKTGNSALSILRDVNDCDKHRLIQVIGVVPNRYIIDVEANQRDAVIEVPHMQIGPLIVHGGTQVKDGTILAKFPTSGLSIGTKMKVKTAIILDYAFEGSKKADGQIIRPTLIAILDEVSRIIGKFEPLFDSFEISDFK